MLIQSFEPMTCAGISECRGSQQRSPQRLADRYHQLWVNTVLDVAENSRIIQEELRLYTSELFFSFGEQGYLWGDKGPALF